jgi:FKBP-type peptidyl-prolyl cis-trans isomerase FkpA
MRNYVFCLLLGSTLFLSGCLKSDIGCKYKDNNFVAPASEEQAVLNYLTANNITATKHASNMYYEIIKQGTGGSPDVCSEVVVNYTASLTTGAQFDDGMNVMFTLGSLIEGWKEGVPLLEKGGRIKLYIPPSLGYGPNDVKDNMGTVIIPANSVLVFDITLVNFQ